MRAMFRIPGWVLALTLSMGLVLLVTAGAVQAQDAATDNPPAAAGEEGLLGEEVDADGRLAQALPSIPEGSLVDQRLPPLGFLMDNFQKGGVFMWPLLFLSVIALAIIIERFWTLSRARVNTRKLMSQIVGAMKQDGLQGAMDVCTRTRGPIAAILYAGLVRAPKGPEAVEKAIESAGTIEMSFLQRGLIWLATIANIAPLMGFLGTVSGMINAFEAIAQAEQVSAKLVATGISEALITTASGLIVAIPVQTASNFFISRIDGFILEMEEASVELVDTLVDMEVHHQGA